jgi:hypothetical protein
MSNELVTLVAPPTEFEANILAIVLKDNGIEAFVFGGPGLAIGVSFNQGTIGVPLQVRSCDVEKATQILIDNKRHSIDIDWDELQSFGKNDDAKEPFEPVLMPITARIAFFCAILALIAGLAVVVLQFLN